MGFLDPDMRSKGRALDAVRAVGNLSVTSQCHEPWHCPNVAGSSVIVWLTQLSMSSPSSYASRFRSRGSENRKGIFLTREGGRKRMIADLPESNRASNPPGRSERTHAIQGPFQHPTQHRVRNDPRCFGGYSVGQALPLEPLSTTCVGSSEAPW